MSSGPSHVPFASAYRPDFAVVTERRGRFTLFPHTQQLPLLHRALNLEFYSALPDYIAKVDKRGNSFQKHLLKRAGLAFCGLFNAARTDGLHLEFMPDPDLVSRLMVVQQITEDTRRGRLHRFKFYGGAEFQPDIRVSGRHLVFTEHVIERFTSRVPNQVGEHLSWLLLVFFGAPLLGMMAGGNVAFILPWQNSFLAFPFEVENNELIITTCLTINQVNTLERQVPPLAFHAHYGEKYEVPKVRHWLPTAMMLDYYSQWERKAPLPSARAILPPQLRWHRVAQMIRDHEISLGHGPGTKMVFLDHVPGPYSVQFFPNAPELRIDERQAHRDMKPDTDWDDIFEQRDHFILHFKLPPRPSGK